MPDRTFRVFCADCKAEYSQTQQSSYIPICCGACGSTWIAVKEIESPAVCDQIEEIVQMEIIRDLDRKTDDF